MPIQEPSSQGYGSAPLYGGQAILGDRFMVDGDFSQCDPCSLPVISFPLKGDSILSTRDVIFIDPATGFYAVYPLGTFPNIQPWSPNQAAAVLEQEFMVAQEYYLPLALNTPYYPAWALGWQGETSTGYPIPALTSFYLVEEGELQDMGGGISKLKRKFATVPPTRNEIEQFAYNFIGYNDSVTKTFRNPATINVQSRVQFDYYIFDDLNILATPLFPDGNRLNSGTGLSPNGFILPPTYYWLNAAGVAQNIFLAGDTQSGLNDDAASAQPNPTVPSFTGYTSIIKTDGTAATSNGLAAELVAEASTLTRFMGNIWERKTRFVIAQ